MEIIDDIVCSYIEHFIEQKHDLRVVDEHVFLIESEMPYLRLYDKEYRDGFGDQNFCASLVGSIPDNHKILFLQKKLEYIIEDIDILRLNLL